MHIFKECKLLFVGIVSMILLYGSVMNIVEWTELFHRTEETYWWCLQTVTSGSDLHLSSILGKVIAGLFMSFGTQLVLIPLMIIANRFKEMYDVNFSN